MTSFFGPEIPAPFCVVSEKHLENKLDDLFRDNDYRQATKNQWNDTDRYDSRFFEKQFCDLISKYLEIDCNDDILFIKAYGDKDLVKGDNKIFNQANRFAEEWPEIIAKKFCLLKGVDVAEINISDTQPNDSNLELRQQEIFESFKCDFIVNRNPSKKYDKIIIKNCLKYFDSGQKYFCKFVMKYFKEQTQMKISLLIIQRVHDLNTLPFHKQVNDEWNVNDARYVKFMQTLQNEFFTIKFDIENLKYMIDCKSTWYNHIKQKYPYPLNQNKLLVNESATKNDGLLHGIRQLNEGVFKYQDINNYVELNDRLMFIGAYHQYSREKTLAERIKKQKEKTKYDPKIDTELNNEIKKLSMEITPDVSPVMNQLKYEENQKRIMKERQNYRNKSTIFN